MAGSAQLGDIYPEIEPHDSGLVEVGDGNVVYWEVSGTPDGKPVVVLHGGPGSGCSTSMRRYFDPKAYRIVLFDQRNCGRSRPLASDPAADLSANTTDHLLRDMEVLREYLRIGRWLVLGFSWGSTLGLAYAEQHPDLVSELVLVGATTRPRREIDWMYRGVAPLFPEQWERFVGGVPPAQRDGDLVEAYCRLLADRDPVVRQKAARAWSEWEWALMSLDSDATLAPPWSDPSFQLVRARIITHYFRHGCFLDDDVLLSRVGALKGVPGMLIHGRLDLQAPLVSAWELTRAWPDAELVVVPGAGHSSGDPGMERAVRAATDRFAPRRQSRGVRGGNDVVEGDKGM